MNGTQFDAARVHKLKTWPTYWQAVAAGEKTFEARKNDRDYQVEDRLLLLPFDPEAGCYLAGSIEAEITYVLRGPSFGVEAGWVVMALRVTAINVEEIRKRNAPPLLAGDAHGESQKDAGSATIVFSDAANVSKPL